MLRATLSISGTLTAIEGVWAAVLGWEPAELAGVSFIERVHPDDFDLVIGAIHDAYATDASSGFACRYAHRDGAYLWLAWELRPHQGRVELELRGQPIA